MRLLYLVSLLFSTGAHAWIEARCSVKAVNVFYRELEDFYVDVYIKDLKTKRAMDSACIQAKQECDKYLQENFADRLRYHTCRVGGSWIDSNGEDGVRQLCAAFHLPTGNVVQGYSKDGTKEAVKEKKAFVLKQCNETYQKYCSVSCTELDEAALEQLEEL